MNCYPALLLSVPLPPVRAAASAAYSAGLVTTDSSKRQSATRRHTDCSNAEMGATEIRFKGPIQGRVEAEEIARRGEGPHTMPTKRLLLSGNGSRWIEASRRSFSIGKPQIFTCCWRPTCSLWIEGGASCKETRAL
jgi:hypothetical protein